ncbi:hypothetical protein B0H12DRAFT_1156942 [Mycena haematopus]|nr:hypothetical protein B0H12DRAFT_1156942 [Mycena haematopus]
MFRSVALFVAIVGPGVAASFDNDNNNNNNSHTSAVIGLVLALVFLTLLCCGVQRRRARQAALTRPSYIQPPSRSPPQAVSPTGSNTARPRLPEFAPPPYVKEDTKPAYAPVRCVVLPLFFVSYVLT